jgi:hypothetical protein
MTDSAHLPVFWVRGSVLDAFKHASNKGKTPDGSDPWIFLSDSIKAHLNLNPNLDAPEDQGEFLVSIGSAAAAATAATVVGLGLFSGPLAPVGLVLGMIGVQPRTCRVIVVNDTDLDLVPASLPSTPGMDATKVAWIDCGLVTAVPAVATSSGGWTAVGIIPKRRTMPDGTKAAGVGCYVFQKNLTALLGFVGTGGVLPFEVKGATKAGIGWLVPQNGASSTATTLDLDGDGGPATLYAKYVDGKREATSIVMGGAAKLVLEATLSDVAGAEATLTACFQPLQPQT